MDAMTIDTEKLICLVISLERSPERRASISEALSALGIPFQFVDAVDASKGFGAEQERQIDRADFFARRGRHMGNGEIACAFSHAKAYRTFLASSAEHCVIFEDDAIPTPLLRQFLDAEAYRAAPLITFYHTKARVFRENAPEVIPGVRLHRLGLTPFGAVAYSVNREAAKQLLAAATPVRDVADWPMDISSLDACATVPNIVGHPPRDQPMQSLLSGDRSEKKKLPKSRLLKLAYWKRKWRKLICKKIS